MRVDMNITTARLPSRYIFPMRNGYQINLTVRYTEEEKFLIKSLALEDRIVFSLSLILMTTICAETLPFYGEKMVSSAKRASKFAMPMIEESFRVLKQLLALADVPDQKGFDL